MKLDLEVKLNSNYMLLVKLSEFSWRLLMTRISIFLHTTIDNVFTQQVIQNNSVLIIRWMQFVNHYIGQHWSDFCQKNLIFHSSLLTGSSVQESAPISAPVWRGHLWSGRALPSSECQRSASS